MQTKKQKREAEKARRWRLKNPEKAAASARRYLDQNREKVKIRNRNRMREWRRNNLEEARIRGRAWSRANSTRCSQRAGEWKKANRDKVNKNYTLRRQTDLRFRIGENLRKRIREVINGNTLGIRKAERSQGLLGCSFGEAIRHIESLFSPGMAWDNYGPHGWHIDHKRPCASFDLTDPEQQKLCFHYTNLQPLWAKDNLTKGAKYAREVA